MAAITKENLNATLGGADSNSYASFEEAEQYFSFRLNSSIWDNAQETDKVKALIMATQCFERMEFVGQKASLIKEGQDGHQALLWPRYPVVTDPYSLGIPWLQSVTGYEEWIDKDYKPIIPKLLKEAQFEQAFYLLASVQGIDKRASLRAQGLDSFIVGKTRETYGSPHRLIEYAMHCLHKLNAINTNTRIVRG